MRSHTEVLDGIAINAADITAVATTAPAMRRPASGGVPMTATTRRAHISNITNSAATVAIAAPIVP